VAAEHEKLTAWSRNLCYCSAILGVFNFLKEVGDSAISCGLLLLGFSQRCTKSVQENGGFTKTFGLNQNTWCGEE
jgi:hypothetical protein